MDWVLKAATNLEKDSFGVSFTGWDQNGVANEPKCSKKPQGVWCVVDGCTADLRGCRDYHRRHRVCETHSKTPVVTVGGKDQRFCQQCSRFHSLGEFDEVKRSCRKRLDGHNRRRRKPRAESMYLNYGRVFTNHPGTKLLRFGGSPPYPATVGPWPDQEKFPQHLQVIVQQSTCSSSSYSHIYSGRKMKFPFLLGAELDKVHQAASSDQVVNTNAWAHHMGKSSKRVTQLVEPKGALSLLSQHTGSSPGNLVQPMGTNSQFCGALNQHLDPINTTLPNDNDHLIGMFHLQPEGMLENGASEFLSFSWR